jgi:hypothetical protein
MPKRKTQEETSAWVALDSAVANVAFQAYREVGQFPELSEVDETILDELDKAMGGDFARIHEDHEDGSRISSA